MGSSLPATVAFATASSSAGLRIPLCSQSTFGLAATISSALGRSSGLLKQQRTSTRSGNEASAARLGRGWAFPGYLPSSGRTGREMILTPSLLRNSATKKAGRVLLASVRAPSTATTRAAAAICRAREGEARTICGSAPEWEIDGRRRISSEKKMKSSFSFFSSHRLKNNDGREAPPPRGLEPASVAAGAEHSLLL